MSTLECLVTVIDKIKVFTYRNLYQLIKQIYIRHWSWVS